MKIIRVTDCAGCPNRRVNHLGNQMWTCALDRTLNVTMRVLRGGVHEKCPLEDAKGESDD